MRALLTACAVLALTACGQTTTVADEPIGAETPAPAAAPQTREEATAQDTCGARAYAAMVGTQLAAATFPAEAGIRIIQPGSMITEDFRPDRLNVNVDANGVITSLECF